MATFIGTKLKKKIRVLQIYRTYFPETQGGGEEAIRQMCLATQSYQVENTIFALANQPLPNEMQLPEGRLVRSKSWLELASCNIGGLDALKRCQAEAANCDIIQIHYPWPFADFLLSLIRTNNKPIVVTYVSDVVRQKGLNTLYSPLRNYLLGSAHRIVASSPNYVKSSEVLQNFQNKINYIPHCLEDNTPPSTDLINKWKSRFGEDFFLFVGVLRYYKGLDFLLDAATLINENIVILGDGPEGSKLRQEAANRGLNNVHFIGALDDSNKNALLSLCKSIVFPSHLRSEAFGITLLEGARAAKPLICCEIGTGTTWINKDDETGLVVPPRDGAALAQSMTRLANDQNLSSRLGLGARLRWTSNISPQVVGKAYRNLYDNVLSEVNQ